MPNNLIEESANFHIYHDDKKYYVVNNTTKITELEDTSLVKCLMFVKTSEEILEVLAADKKENNKPTMTLVT